MAVKAGPLEAKKNIHSVILKKKKTKKDLWIN